MRIINVFLQLLDVISFPWIYFIGCIFILWDVFFLNDQIRIYAVDALVPSMQQITWLHFLPQVLLLFLLWSVYIFSVIFCMLRCRRYPFYHLSVQFLSVLQPLRSKSKCGLLCGSGSQFQKLRTQLSEETSLYIHRNVDPDFQEWPCI